ncbi:hypothetical protein GA0070616_2543 [Micromonospora nigra]|uniref:Uncharacterized protein n=1 Tax=Micromonospora nigra TaxID=145857 RepID=A0A1C6RZE8_9ACTN|nr:hypothetical protein [Micromonospora nigra]SCL22470.1 hypothetical protein GA0070616_2543 [Micromonospora nigra]
MSDLRRPTGPNPPKVEPGVYRLTRAASPQFVTPITVRIFRHLADRHPPWGWAWVDCYQLNSVGDATARRELFVLVDGLEPVPEPARPARRATARAGT